MTFICDICGASVERRQPVRTCSAECLAVLRSRNRTAAWKKTEDQRPKRYCPVCGDRIKMGRIRPRRRKRADRTDLFHGWKLIQSAGSPLRGRSANLRASRHYPWGWTHSRTRGAYLGVCMGSPGSGLPSRQKVPPLLAGRPTIAMIIKHCVICNQEFTCYNSAVVTCGGNACKRAQKSRLMTERHESKRMSKTCAICGTVFPDSLIALNF